MANLEGSSIDIEKPVRNNDLKFPPFPDPSDDDFEEDIAEDERNHYKAKFADISSVKYLRLHCSACDRHLGSSTRNESRMRAHPMLRTLVCHTCHNFYNSGEFEKGDDGSELYCRWCGQGGQVYCCSDCPHVFCAKCIKRNLGAQKIKEIENADDWKCFKCSPKSVWDLRALCWALLRYCDLKNKITYKTEDPLLKELYQKDCAVDYSDCCKYRSNRRKERIDLVKPMKIENRIVKKDAESTKKTALEIMSKIPSTIQVKKFASMSNEDSKERKSFKRSASPLKNKSIILKNPINVNPISKGASVLNPILMPPLKKIRLPMSLNPVRLEQESGCTYTRIRPKPIMNVSGQYNGYNNSTGSNINADNINLSLESLTQGLDMAAVAAMSNNSNQDDDVVCTPDFPLEPMCEVSEDNNDDDVQCITPGPMATPKIPPPPLVSRSGSALPDLSPENIIQMTDNDVTVNSVTGGLKFRVDPQTLSSNKMYRLPDGRIFAINSNPSMPGGYSATIVAVTENITGKTTTPKGSIYSAKLSTVSSVLSSTPSKQSTFSLNRASISKPIHKAKVTRGTDTSSRKCDLHVPIEWYRYNLIDATDALEYSLSRLNKLKRETTSMFLRTRNVIEMRALHKTLDRLLNTSAIRFNEIRVNLNKEFKQYIIKKVGGNVSEDDDDVEILPDLEENDDPIYIDENSVESSINDCSVNQEVDLTGAGCSDHNDSIENKLDEISKDYTKSNNDITIGSPRSDTNTNSPNTVTNTEDSNVTMSEKDNTFKSNKKVSNNSESDQDQSDEWVKNKTDLGEVESNSEEKNESHTNGDTNGAEAEDRNNITENVKFENEEMESKDGDKINDSSILNTEPECKLQETEFNEEMIESLLNDDTPDRANKMASSAASIVEGV